MPPRDDHGSGPVQTQLAIQDHESRIGHVEERVTVHDRALFGFNGKEPGLVGRVQGIEEAATEYRKHRFLAILTLAGCMIQGLIAIGIAALK